MERTLVFRKKPEPKFDIPVWGTIALGTALFAVFLVIGSLLPGRFSAEVQQAVAQLEERAAADPTQREWANAKIGELQAAYPPTFASDLREKIFDRGALQYSIFLVFWWSVAFFFFKWNQLQQLNTKGFNRQIEATIPRQITPDNAFEVMSAVGNTGNFIFDYRVRKSLQILQDQRDANAARAFQEKQTLADEDAAFRSYSFVRFTIWAMPILGFIGTVLGISVAVAGFSGSLTESVADISAIKTALKDVVGGLSIAFDTTLVALIVTTIVMLAYTLTLRQEQMRLGTIDALARREIGARLLIPIPKAVEPLDEIKVERAFASALAKRPDPVDEEGLRRVFGAALGDNLQTFSRLHDAARDAGHEIAEAIVSRFKETAATIQTEQSAFAKQMAEQTAATFNTLVQEQTRKLETELKGINSIFERVQSIADAQRQASAVLKQLQGVQTDNVRRVHASLQGVFPLLQGLSRGFVLAPSNGGGLGNGSAASVPAASPAPPASGFPDPPQAGYAPPAEALFSSDLPSELPADDDPWVGASTLTDSKQFARPFDSQAALQPPAGMEGTLDDWGETLETWDESQETWDSESSNQFHATDEMSKMGRPDPFSQDSLGDELEVILPGSSASQSAEPSAKPALPASSGDPFDDADAMFGGTLDGGFTLDQLDPNKSRGRKSNDDTMRK